MWPCSVLLVIQIHWKASHLNPICIFIAYYLPLLSLQTSYSIQITSHSHNPSCLLVVKKNTGLGVGVSGGGLLWCEVGIIYVLGKHSFGWSWGWAWQLHCFGVKPIYLFGVVVAVSKLFLKLPNISMDVVDNLFYTALSCYIFQSWVECLVGGVWKS